MGTKGLPRRTQAGRDAPWHRCLRTRDAGREEAEEGALQPSPSAEALSGGGDLPRCRLCVAFMARDQWPLLAFAGIGSHGLSSWAGMPIKL